MLSAIGVVDADAHVIEFLRPATGARDPIFGEQIIGNDRTGKQVTLTKVALLSVAS